MTLLTPSELKTGMRDLETHFGRKFTERHVRLWWAKLQDLTLEEWNRAIDQCLLEPPAATLPVPRDIRAMSGADRRPSLALPPARITEADRQNTILAIQNFRRAHGW